MKIALLSNVTVDLLAGMLRKNNEVYLSAGFDTWQQEMINQESELYSFGPQAVIVLLHAGAIKWNGKEEGMQIIDEWLSSLTALVNNASGIPVFVSSIDVKTSCSFGAEIHIGQYLENYLIERVEEMHRKGFRIYILPIKEAIESLGRKNFYSEKMWYVGSMPYSLKGLDAINEVIGRYISVINGKLKKCIAIDLDNTIWGGVIGEDGIDNIELSDHKEGARYYDTQILLKRMKDQGVMLAIISKNNIEDVEPMFNHPFMVLHHDDFVSEKINWNSKSSNIRQMAGELNIGLDSFVFLDDNPAEREQMKAECPEVTVIDFPKDSSLLPTVLEKAYYDFFFALEVTGEDKEKTAMYRAESQRKADLSNSSSVEVFLKKLGMKMSIHKMNSCDLSRVVQLVNKTNQFNVTTKRYSENEIKEKEASGDIITVNMSDKYGEQGLVSVVILKYEEDRAIIDSFLMSCRVMGRNAETEIMAIIGSLLEKKGVQEVYASYIKTAKNSPVEKLFDKLGFSLISQKENVKEYMSAVKNLPKTTGLFQLEVEDLC